jgi:hypothetical protein
MEENKKVITGMSTVLTDGTLSNEIPFGVKSENVELENKKTLADAFNNTSEVIFEEDITMNLDSPGIYMYELPFELNKNLFYTVTIDDQVYSYIAPIKRTEDFMTIVGVGNDHAMDAEEAMTTGD